MTAPPDNGSPPRYDPVHQPAHYTFAADPAYETRKVIEAWGLGYSLGNVVKYVSRAGRKSPERHVEDLAKAITYLRFEIERVKRLQNHSKHLDFVIGPEGEKIGVYRL